MLKDKAILNYKIETAAFFDILSVWEIKWAFSSKKRDIIWKEMKAVENSLKEQLGDHDFDLIYSSPEYSELLKANQNIFFTIDWIKKPDNNMLARDLDALNYKRYQAKMNLQKRFFGNLNEVKIGYD